MISIVIPLYNKAHTIVNTLQKVLDQTYKNFEVVIVDDGCVDNSVEIIRQFTNDHRIRIIRQENQGVSVARNRGVTESQFEYIAFLDADDEWKPNYLETMVNAIHLFPSAGMFCSAGTVRHANGTETLRLAKKYEGKVLKIDFFQNPGVFLHTSATVVKKSFFDLTDGFPLGMKRNQDFALFFSIALISEVVYSGFPLSVYVGGVAGQATQSSTASVINHVVDRYNHVHKIWESGNKANSTYLVYTRYELRHLLITLLRKKDFKTIQIVLTKLDKPVINLLGKSEKLMYGVSALRNVNILFILFTKVIWRMHKFPVVRS